MLNYKKPVYIFLDFDGVLAATNRRISEWFEARDIVIPPHHCDRTSAEKILDQMGYTEEEVTEFKNGFFPLYEEKELMITELVQGAYEAVNKLCSKGYHPMLCTYRPTRHYEGVDKYLDVNKLNNKLKGWVLPKQNGNELTKSFACSCVDGIKIIIDDDIRHIKEAHIDGVYGILLMDGSDEETIDDEKVYHNWDEALKRVDEIVILDELTEYRPEFIQAM